VPESEKSSFIVRPLCPFCSKPWTDDMIKVLDVSQSGGCDTCGHGATTTATVDITCDSCKRLIYRKEFYDRD